MAIFLARQKGSGGTGNLQSKTFTAGTSSATYTPDTGYVGFDEVTVDPTPSETKTQAAGTSNIDVTPTSGKLLSKVTITPQQHSDSFTPIANLQGAAGNANDMGASHNKRYINTSGMIVPSGNKAITSNGTGIDVSSYSTASVAVPDPTLSGDADEANVLSGKTFYKDSLTKKTGSMTNRGAWTATGTAGSNTTIPAGYHNGSGYVYSPSSSPSIQTKNAGTQTPSASWSSSTTGSVTISKDSGYDGMSSVTFNVPMIRDGEMLKYSTTTTPGTIYKGDTSYSNSKSLLRVAPYKDGMAYTGSYLYVDPSEAGLVAPSGTYSISSNGTYDITNYASVSVSVSGSTPSGTYSISSNGTYNISSYAYVSVSVASSSWPDISTGRTTLWTNSSYSTNFNSQTISISSFSSYKYVGIVFYSATDVFTENLLMTTKSLLYASGSNSAMIVVLAAKASGGTVYERTVSCSSYTSLTISAAIQRGTTSTNNNKYAIPRYVYGFSG